MTIATERAARAEAFWAKHPTSHGRFERGDQVRVKGERGTFVWQYATIVGEYVEHTVVGGCGGRKAYRTFTPERIIKRRRQNVEA